MPKKKLNMTQMEPLEGDEEVKYKVDEFVGESVSLRITPFMLDSYSHEYEDIVVCSANKHLTQLADLHF